MLEKHVTYVKVNNIVTPCQACDSFEINHQYSEISGEIRLIVNTLVLITSANSFPPTFILTKNNIFYAFTIFCANARILKYLHMIHMSTIFMFPPVSL